MLFAQGAGGIAYAAGGRGELIAGGAGFCHCCLAEQVAIGTEGAGVGIIEIDRHRRFVSRNEHPRPFAPRRKAVLGASVDTAIGRPIERDVICARCRHAAAFGDKPADQHAFFSTRRAASGAIVSLLEGGGNPVLDRGQTGSGYPEQKCGHQRSASRPGGDPGPLAGGLVPSPLKRSIAAASRRDQQDQCGGQRVFALGDDLHLRGQAGIFAHFAQARLAHRHPPSNGLGSNTSIQDAYNLAWKLAAVLKGEAAETLLDTYSVERAPVAKQIVTRANQSIGEFGPIFEALGMDGGTDIEKIQRSMDARCDETPDAERQREALSKAIEFKKYEFDAHGVEMNQRYNSTAAVTDGQMEPAFELDAELHYQPTTWPGARIPHAWVYDQNGGQHSTLDITGKGRFTLLTGIAGAKWADAVAAANQELGLDVVCHIIGPRRALVDHHGEWARAREVSESGCVLVRPDHHVAWRAEEMVGDPGGELIRVLSSILGRSGTAALAAAE